MEPGYQYEVELPPYREAEYADLISPFYAPIVIPLRVLSKIDRSTGELVDGTLDVNDMIGRFDSMLVSNNESVLMNRRLGQPTNVDSIILQIESNFITDSLDYFSDYRRYRYGLLKLNEGKMGLESLSLNYLGPVVRELHPGFVELFRAMFKDFLFYYSRTSEGEGIRHCINRTHDLKRAREIIGRHPAVWNDTLTDMILLQELSELFYEGTYHKEAILIILDSMVNDPASPDFALYASQVKDKLSSLVIGHPPPAFKLADPDGKLFSLEDFNGKYIYLMFCTPDHYGCMMEYPFLKSYHEKHAEYLVVLTVMVTEKQSQLKEFMQRNEYHWKTLYYGSQTHVLDDYLVRAFPTAYLIGPDGNLVLSPAPLPSDGFEQQLFRIMRYRGEI